MAAHKGDLCRDIENYLRKNKKGFYKMDYKVKINGKEYTLPVRTIAVDEKMSRLAALGKRCKTGEITRREVMEGQYRFVEEMAPGAFPDLETADVNMILKACMDIVAVYAAPSLEMMQGVLNNPDMQKAVELAKLNQ